MYIFLFFFTYILYTSNNYKQYSNIFNPPCSQKAIEAYIKLFALNKSAMVLSKL